VRGTFSVHHSLPQDLPDLSICLNDKNKAKNQL
jgi:hypothetical protein